MKTFKVLVFSIFLLGGAVLAAENGAHRPQPGSQERKELMDAIRGQCERDLQQPVKFKVEHLNVEGDWAFVRVTPLQPDGKPVDYKRTKYRQAVEADMFGGMGEGLLHRKDGRWIVTEWRFGATDTEIDLWAKKHQLPNTLFR